MKRTIIFAIALLVVAGTAQAQLLETTTGASVNANVGVGQIIKASTTVDVNATGTVKRNENANSNSKSNSTSSDSSSNSTTSVSNSNGNSATTSSRSSVSLSAREIRGWSEEEKSDFLLTVKSHAELQSGQDLENFAKGVIASDENVEAVTADESHVEVSYKLPAKFLGIFGTEIDAVTNVSFDQETSGNGPKEVTVKFPWYRMFYSLDADARADVIETAIESNVTASSEASTTVNASSRNGKVIQLISDILKGIRASVDTETEVSVE